MKTCYEIVVKSINLEIGTRSPVKFQGTGQLCFVGPVAVMARPLGPTPYIYARGKWPL